MVREAAEVEVRGAVWGCREEADEGREEDACWRTVDDWPVDLRAERLPLAPFREAEREPDPDFPFEAATCVEPTFCGVTSR